MADAGEDEDVIERVWFNLFVTESGHPPRIAGCPQIYNVYATPEDAVAQYRTGIPGYTGEVAVPHVRLTPAVEQALHRTRLTATVQPIKTAIRPGQRFVRLLPALAQCLEEQALQLAGV